VGVGLGWKLQAGSIRPVWYNGVVQYYVFSDATGAEYVLDQNNGGIWSSQDGIYVFFDANTDILHFTDGSFWKMTIQSAAVEADAGTLYPSIMEDSNGNYIALNYAPAIGCACPGYGCYSAPSSRILNITDTRGERTYMLGWTGSDLPHLASIYSAVSTGENYTVSTGTRRFWSPSP
jgi:hypothetical protein